MRKNWESQSHEQDGAKIIVVSNYEASNKVCNYAMIENTWPSTNDIGQWKVKYRAEQ